MIVAAVVYVGLSVFQNTLADILLRGVLVLVVLLFVFGFIFQFPLTTWLAGVAPSLILVLAVVFAPEIRRVLERLGRSSTTLGLALNVGAWEDEETIAAISRASAELSRRSWGALIVIERDVGLADYSGAGCMINGRVSAQILLSIFFPNSELHDLAVIIHGRTVVSAGIDVADVYRNFLHPASGFAAPRGDGDHRTDRCRGGGRVGGDRRDFTCR